MSVVLKDKTVKVTKEADEMAESIVSLVESSKKHVADGFQAGTDLPVILMENMQSMLVGIDGMEKMGAESKEQLIPFITAWNLAGLKIAELFLKKDEPAV